MRRLICVFGFLSCVIAGSSVVSADVLTVTPSQAVVLPGDVSGLTRVALLFDLSGMRSGAGRRIDEALLDWRVAGVPSNRRSNFSAYPVSGTWTVAGAVLGTALSIEPGTVADWEFESLDHQRNGGGLIRLDLSELVGAWTSGTRSNYGLVVTSGDVSGNDLSTQLSQATLTVRYGFIR